MNYGTYEYFLNGEPTGVIETFESKILPDCSKFTTSTRNAKSFKTTITVETIEKDNRFQNCKIVYQKDENKIEASYEFSDSKYFFMQLVNGESVQNESLLLTKNTVFFPLMRCFQGQTILQVAKNQEFKSVIVPDIQPSTDFENLLKPAVDERTAKFLKKEAIAFYEPESVTFETNVYQYLSQHYDDNSLFWINDDGLLVAYQFVQAKDKIWSVHLKT